MANIKSSKKRAIQNDKNRLINLARKSAVKTAIKKVQVALAAGKTQEEVTVLFNDAQSQLRRAAGKGLIHLNAAARRVSGLAKKMNVTFAK